MLDKFELYLCMGGAYHMNGALNATMYMHSVESVMGVEDSGAIMVFHHGRHTIVDHDSGQAVTSLDFPLSWHYCINFSNSLISGASGMWFQHVLLQLIFCVLLTSFVC
jgi:hypothetical protein